MAGHSDSDAPIGTHDDLMAIEFPEVPSMIQLARIKARIRAGFGTDAIVDVRVTNTGRQRVEIEIRRGKASTTNIISISIPVGP